MSLLFIILPDLLKHALNPICLQLESNQLYIRLYNCISSYNIHIRHLICRLYLRSIIVMQDFTNSGFHTIEVLSAPKWLILKEPP